MRHVRYEQRVIGRKERQGCGTIIIRKMKPFGIVAIPSITTTLKDEFLFRNIFLLLLKFSRKNSEIEWYISIVVCQMWVGLGWACSQANIHLYPMKPSRGGGGGEGGYTGIRTRGLMMARYKSWFILFIFFLQVVLLGVSDHFFP